MAKLLKLERRIEGLKEEYFNRHRIAEENRGKENSAAVQIQSWFRGCRVRAYLRHLNRKATIIQKIWRGYTARMLYRQMIKTAYFIMKMNFYNEMAVKIQKRWRGYYIRKYVHNYYARKKYFKGLTEMNETVRKELAEFAEIKRMERERMALEKEEKKKCYEAQRMHYLLSTHQCPGVFNSPYRPFPDEMELKLQMELKPQSMRPLSLKTSFHRKETSKGLVNMNVPGSPLTLTMAQPLPPIPKKKPQGPFRDPAEVLQQRFKPLEPTLRVATSITSVEEARKELRQEEWRNRLNDEPFRPFANAHKNKKYEEMINTLSRFEQITFDTKHQENQEKLKEKKPFKTVFTTVHVFDKFGRMYSNAGKIV
uniref:Spermatogenesis associated 17 n=1 Tax=Lepisosteus oculatus TaxID=7918 RepID=W5NGM8_LEPOC|nr:PREDICTED: spermatogenesis-associated protein 17 isoform X1 [Lepisosteus oculatus]